MSHGHSHHDAPPNPYLERRRTPEETAALEQRVKTLESLLIEKGYVTKETIDKIVDVYENDFGPENGAKVVARARARNNPPARLR